MQRTLKPWIDTENYWFDTETLERIRSFRVQAG